MPSENIRLAVERIPSSVPDDFAARLEAIGDIIAPGATAALYTPLHAAISNLAPTVIRDISYGSHERHLLDVFTGKEHSKDLPVLIFIHGGGFVGGNKCGPASPFYDNVMQWAVRHGMVGVNATYRLAPAYQWPSVREDLNAVVAWVRAHIQSYSGNPNAIFLLGHSAGAAHIAQYLGQREMHPQEGKSIRGAMLLSGIYTPSDFSDRDMVASYFGTDESLMMQRDAVPGLANAGIPLFFAYAQFDPVAFKTQARETVRRLGSAGCSPQLVELSAHNHLSEVYAINTGDHGLSGTLQSFVEKHVRLID